MLIMDQFSSMDVYKWINQHKSLIETSRITQIYRQDKKRICLGLNTQEGKKYLILYPPQALLLIDNKPSDDHKTTGFGTWMRSNMKGFIIKSIEQIDSERIVMIDCGKYKIFIELFHKGNVLICDEHDTIIMAIEKQIQQGRDLANNEKYQVPQTFDTFHASANDFSTHIKNISENDAELNCSQFFAIKCNLGGKIAKEICAHLSIDPQALLENLKGKEEMIVEIIAKLCSEPKDFSSYEKEVLEGPKDESLKVYEQKLKQADKIIEKQKESLEQSKKTIIELTKQGEFIYQHYALFQRLCDAYKKDPNLSKEDITTIIQEYGVDIKYTYKKPFIDFKIKDE